MMISERTVQLDRCDSRTENQCKNDSIRAVVFRWLVRDQRPNDAEAS